MEFSHQVRLVFKLVLESDEIVGITKQIDPLTNKFTRRTETSLCQLHDHEPEQRHLYVYLGDGPCFVVLQLLVKNELSPTKKGATFSFNA